MGLWTSSGFSLGKRNDPQSCCFFLDPVSKKTWRIRQDSFFDIWRLEIIFESFRVSCKVLSIFVLGPFCQLGMEQTFLHRVSSRFLVILSKVPDDTGPRKFIPSWVSQTIWPNSFFFYVVASNILYFHPYLGKISILTDIFSNGLVKNHQLVLVSFRLEVPMSCFSEQQKSIFQSWI